MSSDRNILSVPEIRKRMPELPAEVRDRIVRDHQLPVDFAFRFVNDRPLLDFFLEAVNFKPDNVKVSLRVECLPKNARLIPGRDCSLNVFFSPPSTTCSCLKKEIQLLSPVITE